MFNVYCMFSFCDTVKTFMYPLLDGIFNLLVFGSSKGFHFQLKRIFLYYWLYLWFPLLYLFLLEILMTCMLDACMPCGIFRSKDLFITCFSFSFNSK